MPSEIIINSTPREIRVALLENNQLVELFIEHKAKKGIVGNVYKGVVNKILPGMQVAFVDAGLDKAGFLYVGDIDLIDLLDYEGDEEDDENLDLNLREKRPKGLPNGVPIQNILREGQEIMVQVAKNPLGTKGARITSYISLPGRYLVYMPTINQISVSRRIEEEAEKERLKEIITKMGKPNEGYIVRTAGSGSGFRA